MKKIIGRYKNVHNLKRNAQVADRMGLSESALSNQIGRDSLDLQKLLQSCDEGVNLHWILTGNGNPKIGKKTNEKVENLEKKFSQYEDSIDDLDKSDISQDETLEFLLNQQEAVLDFLRKMKKNLND